MMMSMAIVLQTFVRVVTCIKRTLKNQKVKLTFDSHHMAISSLAHIKNNRLNKMISKICYKL